MNKKNLQTEMIELKIKQNNLMNKIILLQKFKKIIKQIKKILKLKMKKEVLYLIFSNKDN